MINLDWLRWPNNVDPCLAPWYVIAWRLPWAPLIYLGLALAWLGILMANGPRQANRFWRDAA